MASVPDSSGNPELHQRAVVAIIRGQEERGVEFKRSEPWKSISSKILRSILAMSNLRGGGLIIVGIEETKGGLCREGISEADLETYSVDDIHAKADTIAAPQPRFEIAVVTHDKRPFLVFQVEEFDETPVVLTRQLHSDTLKPGDFLIRSSGKAESRRVRDAQETHELLRLAMEKQVHREIERMRKLGLLPSGEAMAGAQSADSAIHSSGPRVKRLDAEFARFDSDSSQGLAGKAIWDIRIVPNEMMTVSGESLSALWQVVESSQSRWHGWRFPELYNRQEFRPIGNDWIGFKFPEDGSSTQWRLYQSGQLVYRTILEGVHEPTSKETYHKWLRGHALTHDKARVDAAVGFVYILGLLYKIAGVIDFCSQLWVNGSLSESLTLHIWLRNVQNVALSTDPNRMWHEVLTCGDSEIGHHWLLSKDAVMGDPIEAVVRLAVFLLERFGWSDPSRDVLRQDVGKYFQRS